MIIGTAGHIDHGKTALVRALTGVDTDRLKEEKKRGISIDLGFAYIAASDGSVLSFVDVPGHEKFIRNMLAGATGIDFILLVVAADDGIMPQTIEHLAIADLLGIKRGVVALSKVDMVSAHRCEEAALDIRERLNGTSLAGAEIQPVSAVTGRGIDALREKLVDAARHSTARGADGRFRLSVDRSFTLSGAGTVVTGTVLSGSVDVGAQVRISPSGLSARVRSIHAQSRPSKRGQAGERCALNLTGDGITKNAIRRGDVVLEAELHAPTDRIDAQCRVLASEAKAVAHWTPVRLYHAADEIEARIVPLGEEPIRPGDAAYIQLVLSRPTAAAAGDRYVLRDTSGSRTIGGGRFLDLRAPARRRRTPERLAQLHALACEDTGQVLAGLLGQPPRYVDLTEFARDRALSMEAVILLVEQLRTVRVSGSAATYAFLEKLWVRLKQDLLTALGAFHAANPDKAGIDLQRLRFHLEQRLPADVLSAAINEFARKGDLALEAGAVRLLAHRVRLAAQDEEVWSKIAPLIADADRFRPPKGRDIAALIKLPETGVRRVLKSLSRQGEVVELAPDHFFLRSTVAEMTEIVAELASQAANGEFTAAQFRDRINTGRKIAIQVLEFLDRHGVTLRRGDLRRIDRRRIGLFGRGAPRAETSGREALPVERPDFKSGKDRQPAFGGFDSHSLPPDIDV
jgi:selenocysteine-specific elongation factor